MLGWLGAYLERRRRRKARAAKMAADSAEMAAVLQANAPKRRSRSGKKLWRAMLPPPPPAPPRPVPMAMPVPVPPPLPIAIPAVGPIAAPSVGMAVASAVPRAPDEAQAPPMPEMYGPPPPPVPGHIGIGSGAPGTAAGPARQAGPPAPEPAPLTGQGLAPDMAMLPQTVTMAAMPPVVVAAPQRARFGWLAASFGWCLRVAVIVLLVAGALAVAVWPVWRESERIDVEVMPLTVPAEFAARGLTPEVAAARLVDALDAIIVKTRENSRNRPSKDDLGPVPTFAVTPDRLSLRSLASLVHELRGRPVRQIAGELTNLDDRLDLRLRVPGGTSFASGAVPASDGPDKAFAAVAPEVWRRLNPVVYAWHVAESGEPEDQIRPLLVAVAQDQRLSPPMELRVSVLYARSLVRSGRAEEALATLEQMEKRGATYPLLWNIKAQALADLGRAEPAMEAQRRAVAEEGTSVWSHISSAHLMMKLGKPREALTDLQSARRLSPNNFEAVMLESLVLLGGGRAADALALINRVVDARPNLPGVQEALGNALLANGRSEEALRAFDAEIARNPAAATTRLARANALRALRRPEEAMTAIDDILKVAPRDGVAIGLRGWTLMDLGRHDQALGLFDTLLKDRPDDAAATHGRAMALVGLGRRPEAIGALVRATELQPGNRRFTSDLARLRGTPPGAVPTGAAPPSAVAPAARP